MVHLPEVLTDEDGLLAILLEVRMVAGSLLLVV